MKRRIYTPWMAVAVVLSLTLPGLMNAGKKSVSTDARAVAKAEYYTRQAFKYPDSADAAFEIHRHALRVNPRNVEAGFNVGAFSIMMPTADTSQLPRSKALMKRYVEKFPGDIDEATFYSFALNDYMGEPEEAVKVQERLLAIYPKRTDIYMTLANYYNESGDLEGALGAVRRYEHIEGMDVRTVTTKADILMMQGDTAAAVVAVDSLAMEHPGDPDSWGLKGELYSMLEKPDSALASYTKAVELAPYRFAPRMMLADFYREQGDSVQADAMMTMALATNDLEVDEKADGLMEFVRGLVANGSDLNRAFPMLEVLLQQDPGNQAVLSLKAAVESQMNRYADLEKTLRDILSIDADRPNIWGQLMLAHINDSDFAALPTVYDEAKKALSRPDPTLDIYLASGYAMDKKPQKAAEVILNAIHFYLPAYVDSVAPAVLADSVRTREYNPQAVANLLQMYGDQIVSLNDTTKGLKIYDQALALDPDNFMTLNNYAYFLALRDSDLDRALEMSLKTINAQPDNGTFLDTYAYVLFKKRDYERARMYQEMAIEKTPESEITPDLYEHYGDILFMLGEHEKAVGFWKKALDKDPGSDILKRKVDHETYFYK